MEIICKKGDVQAAYDSLLCSTGKVPTLNKINALYLYGSKLGKIKLNVIEDLKRNIAISTRPCNPFEGKLYNRDNSLSLADCQGKVMLLTFWFPGCGPCKEEFYHIVNVLKITNRNLEYIGVNAVPRQEQYVADYITHSGVTFTPLHGNTALLNSNNIYEEPTNFIIGKRWSNYVFKFSYIR